MAATVSAPRTSAQLVRDRDFGLIFWSKILINSGIWAQTIIVVILTYQITRSASWVGVVGAAQLGPQLALAMLSGRLSDRRGPVSLIITGGIVCGSGCLGLATWLMTTPQGPDLQTNLAIVGAALVCGVGNTLFAPAFQSIVPMLVTEDELDAALALNFAPTSLARTIGPAAGSLLLAVMSPATALLAIGLAMWAVTGSVAFVRRPEREAHEDHRISTALRFVWSDRKLMALLLGVTAIAGASEPAITLAPAIATQRVQDASPGWITTCFGLGGLLGVVAHTLTARRLAPITQGTAAMFALASGMIFVAFTRSIGLLTAALLIGGAAMVLASIGFSIAVVQRCPRRMLGRVMGLWVIAFAGSRPLAGILLGLTADHVSLPAAILAAALVAAATAAILHFALLRTASSA